MGFSDVWLTEVYIELREQAVERRGGGGVRVTLYRCCVTVGVPQLRVQRVSVNGDGIDSQK